MASDDEKDLEAIAEQTERLLSDPALTPKESRRLLDQFLGTLGGDPERLEAELERLKQETDRMTEGNDDGGK